MGSPTAPLQANKSFVDFQLRQGPPAMSPPTLKEVKSAISGNDHKETELLVAAAKKFPNGLQQRRMIGDTKAITCDEPGNGTTSQPTFTRWRS